MNLETLSNRVLEGQVAVAKKKLASEMPKEEKENLQKHLADLEAELKKRKDK